MRFRPFYDNMGITNSNFEQILVPGSGSSDVDSYKANVFGTAHTEREREIKEMINKLPYELIGEDFLYQKEKLAADELVYRRYNAVFDYMEGKASEKPKTLAGKKQRRLEAMQVRKEIKQMAKKIEEKEAGKTLQGRSALDKFRKIGKK